MIGEHEAHIFSATYRPKQTVCPACGGISDQRKVRDYRSSEVLMTPGGHRLRVLELKKAKYDCADCGPHLPTSLISLRLGLTPVMNTNLSYPALLTLFPSANLVIDGFMLSKSCRGPLTSFGLRKWRNSRISKAIREESIVSSRNTGDNFSNGMVRSIIRTGNNVPFFVGMSDRR